MKLILNILKIVVLLVSALGVAAAALLGYDRYLRQKYPAHYVSPNQVDEDDILHF